MTLTLAVLKARLADMGFRTDHRDGDTLTVQAQRLPVENPPTLYCICINVPAHQEATRQTRLELGYAEMLRTLQRR